jgi:hypothetical protein
MAISVFPAPVTSSVNAKALTLPSPNVFYSATTPFTAGVYTVTCVSTTMLTFEFYSSANVLLLNSQTVSGTITISLASDASTLRLYSNTGTNVIVTITQTALTLPGSAFSGTLDTITTVGNSTYTGTSTSGYGYAVLVGGGGGGGGRALGDDRSGGGGSGGVCAKYVQLTGSMAVTIGAAGDGGASPTAGGASTFDGMTAGGGGRGGISANAVGAGGTATGGTLNSAGGAGGSLGYTGNNGGATTLLYPHVVNGTTGGGRGGSNIGPAVAGAGSGIGTGGASGFNNGNGGNATGYGAGGGGGGIINTAPLSVGGNGTQGVLYVLRF